MHNDIYFYTQYLQTYKNRKLVLLRDSLLLDLQVLLIYLYELENTCMTTTRQDDENVMKSMVQRF